MKAGHFAFSREHRSNTGRPPAHIRLPLDTHAMAELSFQYALAGVATAIRLQPAAAFLAPPPQIHLPPSPPEAAPGSLSGWAERRSSAPPRSLISSWLTGADREEKRIEQQSSIQVATQTLRAPLESFEGPQPEADGPQQQGQKHHQQQQHQQQQQQQQKSVVSEEAKSLAGLLCLERSIPNDVMSGLERLADGTAPFKVEVLRAGGGRGSHGDTRWYPGDDAEEDGGWLETLVNPLLLEPGDETRQRRSKNSARRGGKQETAPIAPARGSAAADDQRLNLEPADRQQHQQLGSDEAQEAVRWLREDINRVANVFAGEVSAVMSAEAASASDEVSFGIGAKQLVKEDESPADVTVKLELLKRGKCPRFHLDKVPIRMICTYVGPSTEWLDAYDKWEMENNRSLPPACNRKISGGCEGQRASPGDVLIFKGRPEGGQAEGGSGARAVAHRSPDTVEGQRRLVLTMDVGDIIPRAAATASRRHS